LERKYIQSLSVYTPTICYTSICVALYSRSKKREREKADSTSRAAGTRWTDGVHPFRDHVLGLGWSGRTESRSRWKESLQSTPEQRTQTPVGRRGKVGRFLGGCSIALLPFHSFKAIFIYFFVYLLARYTTVLHG
jgi:hypothetical protein